MRSKKIVFSLVIISLLTFIAPSIHAQVQGDNSQLSFILESLKKIVASFNELRNTQSAAVADFDSSLVAHYRFDGNANDSKGSNDGAAQGGPTYTSGKIGQAMQFDGVDDYVSVPDSASLSPTNAITISAWIKTTTAPGPNTKAIVNKINSYSMGVAGSGATAFSMGLRGDSTSDGFMTSIAPFNDNNWHLLTVTFGNQTMKGYVDGVLVKTQSTQRTFLDDAVSALQIGGPGPYAAFTGMIDDVRIYSTDLTSSQIRVLYDDAGTVSPPTTAGSCGPAAKTYTATESFPSGALCSVGTASPSSPTNPTQGGSTSWSCAGTGSTAQCSATRSVASSDTQAPTTPGNPTSSNITSTSVTLSWSASSDNIAVTRYAVERCTGAGCSNFGEVGTPSSISYTNTGLTPNTTYLYRVKATDAAGNSSGYSSTVSVTTPAAPATTYTLTVAKSGTGSGTVSGGTINCGSTCIQLSITAGTSIALTATPASDSTFTGWSGGCSGTGNCTVTMSANTTVTASFNQTTTVTPAAIKVIEWTAPIGIPEPSFGIREDVTHYIMRPGENCTTHPNKCFDFGSGLVPYPLNEIGEPYTHIVEPTHPNATESSNPYGMPSKPKRTLPMTFVPGMIVELRGMYNRSIVPIHYYTNGGGTATRPAYFRGSTVPGKSATFADLIFQSGSHYLIIENINFPDTSPNFWPWSTGLDIHHNALRHSTLGRGTGAGSMSPGVVARNIVFYGNDISYNGTVCYFVSGVAGPCVDAPYDYDRQQYFYENDEVGVYMSSNSEDIWVVDNYIHDLPGDTVGGGHGVQYTAKRYYVGRNELARTGENAIDIKEVDTVILSQNKMHSFSGLSSGAGGGGGIAGVHYGPQLSPKNVWFIFNELYDANGTAFTAGGDQVHEVFFIGNVVHDIKSDAGNAWAYKCWSCQIVNIVGNTFYNVDNGLWVAAGEHNMYNNVFYNVESIDVAFGGDTPTRAATDLGSSFFGPGPAKIALGGANQFTLAHGGLSNVAQALANGNKCAGCKEGNGNFVNPSSGDFRPQAGSPVINAADSAVIETLASRFQTLVGLDIHRDIAGAVRPQGGFWDIGAYEYTGPLTPAVPTIVSQPSPRTVASGQTANFTVGVSAYPAPTYRWQKASPSTPDTFVDISGEPTALTSSYTTPPRSINNSGERYRVIVTNSQGSVTSNPATLTVSNTQTNTPPVVTSSDRTITLPVNTITLTATAVDAENDPLTYSWSQVDGPSAVQSTSLNTLNPTVTFTLPGTYILRLTVSDGTNIVDYEITITLNPNTTVTNLAPVVSLGNDRDITLPATFTPNVSVSDDGLPNNTLTYTWTKVSGPNLTFSATNIASPALTFPNPGTYTVRLTVSDGALSTSDDLTITVNPSDPNIPDSDSDGIPNNIDHCPNTPANIRSAVNQHGCPRPLANNFDIRPDFDSIDLREGNRSFELGRSQFGKISWNNRSISFLHANPNSAVARLDLDSNIQIERNRITLNSTNIPNLNQPATLSFFNTTISRPKVLKDGQVCTACSASKSGTTIAVTVPGFSTYEIIEDEEVTSSTDTSTRRRGGGGGGNKKVLPQAVAGASTAPMTRDQMIALLFELIKQLNVQLQAEGKQPMVFPGFTSSTPTTSSTKHVFNTDLYLNINHGDVWHLQRFLNTHGYPVGTNIGSYGKEVNTFGPVTESTLKKFQQANGINPTGYFGPETRARVNLLNK